MKKNGITRIRVDDWDNPPKGDTDWEAFDALTDEEVHARALADPDAQPMTEEELKRMRRLPNVRAIREKLGMTQEAFAKAYGFHVATVRDWEQRRRLPLGPASSYLRVIAAEPEMVRRALAAE